MDNLERTRMLFQKNSFITWIGIEIDELELDRAVVRLEPGRQHLNPYGIVHGGVYATMADTAAGIAARTDGRDYVTQCSTLNFLHSQREGMLRAEARIRHRGRSTCVVEVEVTGTDGKLLATGTMTFFCLGNEHFTDESGQINIPRGESK